MSKDRGLDSAGLIIAVAREVGIILPDSPADRSAYRLAAVLVVLMAVVVLAEIVGLIWFV